MMPLKYFDTCAYPIHFGFCTSEKSFRREMKRIGIKESVDFNSSGMTTHFFECLETSPSKIAIVCCEKSRIKETRLDAVLALIAHEAVHVWQETKDEMREDNPGRECEAYAIQFFTQLMLVEALKIRGVEL